MLSSDFTAVIPSKLGKAVATRVDAEDGSDSWTDVASEVGPAGVKALRPLENNLGTECAQFNEPARKAPAGAVLVFRIYCTQSQTIILSANNNFSTEVEVKGSPDWQNIEIRAEQLRLTGRPDILKDWSSVKTIALKPKIGLGITSNITWILFSDMKWKVPATSLPKP